MEKVWTRVKVADLIPYENNPRKIPKEAIEDVKESYRQCGVIDPIEINEENVILSGHTRRLAAIEMGIEEVECLRVVGLTEEQQKKYRLLANKTAEKSGWDFALLELELNDIDWEGYNFGFDEEDQKKLDGDTYTNKVDIPQYEPSGEFVILDEMCDRDKYEMLIAEIEASSVEEQEKEFLKMAAARHLVFQYNKIADYYANASAEMQRLMEKSALVIIDYDNAIANGYVKLSKKLEMIRTENA